MPASQLLYLYGISAKAPKLKIPTSIDGNSLVEHLETAGLTAWYSRVSLTEFGERLASNMENLEWLSSVSVRHQRTVAQISEAVTLLPARFGTLFNSEKSLRDHISEQKGRLTQKLARIDGAEEWGVKLFRTAATPPSEIKASSGRDYLRAKSAMTTPKRRTELDAEVADFVRELQSIAADSAPTCKVRSSQPKLEWQATFLVRKKDRPKRDKALK